MAHPLLNTRTQMLQACQYSSPGLLLWTSDEDPDLIWFFLKTRRTPVPRVNDILQLKPRMTGVDPRRVRVVRGAPMDAALVRAPTARRGAHTCTGFLEVVDLI